MVVFRNHAVRNIWKPAGSVKVGYQKQAGLSNAIFYEFFPKLIKLQVF